MKIILNLNLSGAEKLRVNFQDRNSSCKHLENIALTITLMESRRALIRWNDYYSQFGHKVIGFIEIIIVTQVVVFLSHHAIQLALTSFVRTSRWTIMSIINGVAAFKVNG